MATSQGKFIWHELATSDVEGARTFYQDVVGWSTENFGDPGIPYVIWKAGDKGVGGLMAIPRDAAAAGAPPRWTAYVMADDVDALTRKAVSLGAKCWAPPTDIPAVGRFSVIADPQGAVLALMTPQGPDQPEPEVPPVGHACWNELLADDHEKAFGFYAQLFGWQKHDAVEMPNGVYQLYGRPGRTLGGMMNRPQGYPAPPHWLHYFRVEDLDSALERVTKGGGKVLMGPMPVPGGSRIAQCTDPQGAMFALNAG